MVWADPQNNALVITAPPKIMRAIMGIVDKLDIRRRQVLVEALIVEVNATKTAELGVNWAEFSQGNGTVPAASFVSPVGGSSIVDLAGNVSAIANKSANATLPAGTTVAIGKLAAGGLNFAAMIRAIRNDTDTNVIATPSTITMDNQEAEIKVAQEIPFITGSFTNTGATNGATNPFQTVQRQEVGTILKVTPTIAAEGNSVVMKISIESSSVGAPVSNVDITTNKRTITTNVLIEDGGIVVLGGLIENRSSKGESKVPFLGSIPLIGLAFKTRTAGSTKNNLMMFIRPKILRDDAQAAYQTDSKYNYMIDQERSYNRPELLPVIPGVKKPLLPPAPPPPPPGSGSDQAGASPDERAAQARKQAEAEAEARKHPQPAKPGASQPPGYATPPEGATTHPEGEPPYATERPGVLMPPTTPPPPPTTPPEGGHP
jgi:general secretion pathway protein D